MFHYIKKSFKAFFKMYGLNILKKNMFITKPATRVSTVIR